MNGWRFEEIRGLRGECFVFRVRGSRGAYSSVLHTGVVGPLTTRTTV